MGKCIQYTFGQVLNKKTGSIYLWDSPTHSKKIRKAWVVCGRCHRPYIAPIKKVKAGHLCSECGHNVGSKKRLDNSYYPGMILNDKSSSTLIEITDKRTNDGAVIGIVKCGYCGNIYEVDINKVKAGHGCELCRFERSGNNKRKYVEKCIFRTYVGTYYLFAKELSQEEDKTGRLGDFIPVDIFGRPIGRKFRATLTAVLCGKATGNGWSHAEIKCYNALLALKVDFVWQYKFSDLLGDNGKKLSFDFAVKNDQTLILIELDGEQHFEPVERFGGEKEFLRIQKYDDRKNNYVQDHSYLNLIRIPYTSFNKISTDYIREILIREGMNIETKGKEGGE